jgi:hypothetical protein
MRWPRQFEDRFDASLRVCSARFSFDWRQLRRKNVRLFAARSGEMLLLAAWVVLPAACYL